MADLTGGPKTTVATFVYGDVVPATHISLMRDNARAASVMGVVNYRNHLLRSGVDIKGINHPLRGWPMACHYPYQDALVDRSRAVTAKKFLTESDAEVLIMIDHDIEWAGATNDYEGDLLHIARKCAQTRSIVGGLVCKKVRGQGIAVLWDPKGENATPNGEYSVGVEDRVIEVHAVGSAFTAYHRECLQAVTDTMDEIPPGFTPIFMPDIINHPLNRGCKLHMSEDWMLAWRAKQLGFKIWAALRPLTVHWGRYGFQVVRDGFVAQGDDQDQTSDKVTPKASSGQIKVPGKKISLIHATRGKARRDHAPEVYKLWKERATDWRNVEYMLSLDDDDLDEIDVLKEFAKDKFPIVAGKDNRGNVDAYNRAAYISNGDILVQVHDDVEPPQDWDKILLEKLDTSKPQVLKTSDGDPKINPSKPWLVPVMICTRKFAKKLGGVFCPEYISVFCDDDASMKAAKEGAIVEAEDVVFKHHWGGADGDATYRRSYQQKNRDHGRKLFKEREAAGFPDCQGFWR